MFGDDAGSYIPNFRFVLRVDGMYDVPLKSVRAFTRENEYDYIQEGGLNDYVHIKRKPISKPYTLVVERYIPTQFDDPLANGVELKLPLMLFVGRNTGGEMNATTFARYYVFTGAVVMSKEYGQLDAERAGLLTETMTIGYNMMFCITSSGDASEYPQWKMNIGSSESGAAGNTTQLYSKKGKDPDQNRFLPSDFKEKAQRWNFKDKEKAGEGTLSAQRQTEDSVKDFFDRKRSYNFASENSKNGGKQGASKSVKSAQNSAYSDKMLGVGRGIKEESKEELVKKSRKFEFTDASHKAGNQQLSSKRNPEELESDLTQMREKATKWEFDGKTKAGAGDHHTQNSLVTEHSESPDGSSTGLGLKENSKEEMAARAKRREFGGVDEPVKDDFVSGSKKWKFDEKTKDGQGDRSRQNAAAVSGEGTDDEISGMGIVEAGKDEMAAVSHKWEFTDEYTKNGNGVQSSAKLEDILEADKSELEQNAKRWQFDGQSKDGQGEHSRQNASMQGTGDDAVASGMGTLELSKEELENSAAKWVFTDKYSKAGGGKASRTTREEDAKQQLADKSRATESFPKPEPTQPEARKWSFNKSGAATKGGEGTASRTMPRKAELTKEEMANKAVRHVHQSITDFLMDSGSTSSGS